MRSPAALLPLFRARQEVTEEEECRDGRARRPCRREDVVDRWTSQLLVPDGEPLTDEDRSLVQFVQRQPLMDDLVTIAKSVPDRNEADASNSMIGNLIRLYNAGDVEQVELPADLESSLQTLPSLPSLKRAQNSLWYHQKTYKAEDDVRNFDSDEANEPSPIHNRHQQNRKSLPHKKRISRKLKKNPSHCSQTIDCHDVDDDRPVSDVIHDGDPAHSSSDHHALSEASLVNTTLHSNRSMFICQLCGDFYGDDQLKFFYHLKQHYEPHATSLILENMPHDENSIALDKIDGSMVITNEPLPDSLVDLSSLDDPVSGKSLLYQSQNKMSDYEAAKSIYNVTLKPSLYGTENKQMGHDDADKFGYIDDSPVEKLLYACTMCPKTFKRQKQFEMHVKDSHSKVEEISEFSEPEDMMEGIHVVVDGENEEYAQEDLSSQNSNSMIIQTAMDNQEQYILPHLTIENGHVVPQTHLDSKEWYNVKANINEKDLKNDGAATMTKVVSDEENLLNENNGDESKNEYSKSEELIVCPVCGGVLSNRKDYDLHVIQCHMDLKEEEIQRMMDFEVDVSDMEPGEIGSFDNVELDAESEEIEEPEKGENKKNKSGKTIFTCNVCTKQFKHRNSVIYHMISHEGIKSFPCEVCKKSFFTGTALKVHQRLHSGDKPYKCVECGRKFRQWGDLKYHFISIHSDVKQHQCEYCGKNFARKYSLIIHRRIHTGEKNYRCEFCQKTFRASSYLQNHRKIHTGERPYPCELCGKRFRMRGDMRRHQRVHNKTATVTKEKVDEKMLTSDSSNGSTKKGKTPRFGTADSKEEMKTEKEEVHGETENEDSSTEIKMTSSGTTVSPLPAENEQEPKTGANFPLENNPMYMWPVFIA